MAIYQAPTAPANPPARPPVVTPETEYSEKVMSDLEVQIAILQATLFPF